MLSYAFLIVENVVPQAGPGGESPGQHLAHGFAREHGFALRHEAAEMAGEDHARHGQAPDDDRFAGMLL
ncbi:hypothetical protein GCM10011494_32240 [Novosphingobium endophyticum]|uniref:Uncharacterized protein n=1 Tax=Novosphingobium endophyticum TaxID=1955250 RepID=A0A916TVT8_9SPHN|nr:hypothetical protein GCM10011494_32240 [Novosphingobium endophyticum]